jgi:hypothetical protein
VSRREAAYKAVSGKFIQFSHEQVQTPLGVSFDTGVVEKFRSEVVHVFCHCHRFHLEHDLHHFSDYVQNCSFGPGVALQDLVAHGLNEDASFQFFVQN